MNGVQPAQGLDTKQWSEKEDDTLINEGDGHNDHHIVIEDWSETGRGSHIDFGHADIIPIEQGRRLGRGAMGDVHEVTIKGVKLAHKTMIFRRKITERNKREIEILKRLSHVHMVQLIGTYTKQRVVGILLYPVAICDLHTFFEDVEAWTSTISDFVLEDATQDERLAGFDSEHKQRLKALNYQFPLAASNSSAIPIYSKIGCLISAIAYLHEEKVRHQDLKPSNILLGPDRVWLSDFGSATDFTLLSQSATDNERGTPRYFSPEMAEFKATGRASDVFSLGCVILEITVLHATGSLSHIRNNRSADASFHANLDRISTWQTWSDKALPPWEYLLHWEIKKMLSKDPEQRPTAQNLLANIRSTETMRRDNSEHLLFGQCCKYEMMSLQEHEQRMFKSKSDLQTLREHLAVRTKAWLQLTTENGKLHDQIKNLSISMRMLEARKQKIEIEIGNIKLENGHLSHKKRELEQMIVVFEDRVSSMAGDLERSEVETRELYLMLRLSHQKSDELSEELDKARSDPTGSARRQKEEDEDSRRRLYANLTGQLQTKRSDPNLMRMDPPSPPSKDIENPLVRTSDSDERGRAGRPSRSKLVRSNAAGRNSGVKVEYVPPGREPSLEKVRPRPLLDPEEVRPRQVRNVGQSSPKKILSNTADSDSSGIAHYPNALPPRSDSTERPRRQPSRERVPPNIERSDSVERPRRRTSRERVPSYIERSGSVERVRRRRSRETVLSNPERSGSIERVRRRRSRETVLSNPERSGSVERVRRRRSRERVLSNTERSGSIERVRRLRSRETVLSNPERSNSIERPRRRTSRERVPSNITLDSQESLEGTNSLRKEARVRSRKFADAYGVDERTSESSGSAKRVMDFFRRRGKQQERRNALVPTSDTTPTATSR